MVPGEAEARNVEAAFAAAQLRTSGPLVCVLARASSNYEAFPLVWSILLALATPWPLLILTAFSADRIFLIQLGVFLLALAVLSLTPLASVLTPRAVKRASAHRAALGQFMIRGLSRDPGRSGVLIYVSLAEHYGRIIADDAAAAAVSHAQWQAIVDSMLARVAGGDVAGALAAAGAAAADLLAPAFPPRPDDVHAPHAHFHIV